MFQSIWVKLLSHKAIFLNIKEMYVNFSVKVKKISNYFLCINVAFDIKTVLLILPNVK